MRSARGARRCCPLSGRVPTILADEALGRAVVHARVVSRTPRDRTDAVVLLVVWVLPLLAVVGLLAAAGLPAVAGALLGVEVAVSLLVLLARRRPARTRTAPAWAVPAAMVLAVGGVVGVAALGARLG